MLAGVVRAGGESVANMPSFKYACVVLLFVAAAVAKVAVHRPCDGVPQDACDVTEVRVDPCFNPRSCRLTKGSPASISFDFTPNFAATKLKTGLFGVILGRDEPFSELKNADGCQFTACPTESGKSQELTYNLTLSKILPTGTYDFKWKLWNEEDETQVCCFVTTVQLRNDKRARH